MVRSIALQKKLARTQEEINAEHVEKIRKIAIDKINSLSDDEINTRVKGTGPVGFSPESSVNAILTSFACLCRLVTGFSEDGDYDDVKNVVIDTVIPIFGKKVLEVKSNDLSKLTTEEKRQALIDLINGQSFNFCQDNAIRDGKPYNPGIIEVTGEDAPWKDNETTLVEEENIGGQKDDPIDVSKDWKNPFLTYLEKNKKQVPGEPVVVKNDFIFSGKKNCVIRFVECNSVAPKYKKPEKMFFDATRCGGKHNKFRWLLSSETLAPEEVDALSICFRKNNRQYTLNRVTLQNIINGKLNKKAPEAMKMVRKSTESTGGEPNYIGR